MSRLFDVQWVFIKVGLLALSEYLPFQTLVCLTSVSGRLEANCKWLCRARSRCTVVMLSTQEQNEQFKHTAQHTLCYSLRQIHCLKT